MTTITSSYKNHAMLNPDKIAIQTITDTISYAVWYKNVCKTANWLDSITSSNETVGIFMPSGVAFLQLFTGSAMAGCIAATFDTKWKIAELEQRLAVSSLRILITTKKLATRLQDLDVEIIIWEDAWEQIRENDSLCNEEIDGETLFYMGFTSGSTGIPKAFVRSHDSWVESFACTRYDFHLDESDHVLIPGALIHSNFLYGAVSTLYLGGTIYLMDSFSPSQALAWIENSRVTALYIVPTMLEAMLLEKGLVTKPMKIISSGAKWEESSKKRIQAQFLQTKMYEFYGASELSFITVLGDTDNRKKPRSVGKPCHKVEVQIRRENMEIANNNEVGKIFVRSNMIFSGYLDPKTGEIQSNREKDDWATVDDIGYLDEEGFLYIIGREKNMILYGGVNVFPEEIEAVLMSHPAVEEAAVIGIEDPYWGQIPVAVVKGVTSEKNLRKLCRENLSVYKQPRKWFIVEEMPHTTNGKIARMSVEKLIESEVK